MTSPHGRRPPTGKPKASPGRRSSRRGVLLKLEVLEDRCLLSVEFRTIDGSNNNLANPTWGKVNTNFIRLSPAAYSDGSSSPAGADRPSSREISNVVADSGGLDILNDRNLSGFVYVFGQFLDHDLDLITVATYADGNPCCPFPIPVPTGDPYFDPFGTGTQQISFFRSKWDPLTGFSQSNPRQQPNEITAWIDGSMIYGSDPERAAALRTFEGGRLKTSAGNLLPFNDLGLPNQNQGPIPDNELFLAGDIRANENIQLTAMHTLFMREHNWWADQIHKTHPLLDDETIYQLARRIVGAELQVITYKEFLPALLGPDAIPPYPGYQPEVNGSISTEFASAGFRFGHSTLNSTVPRLNNLGQVISLGNLSLQDTFFNPKLLDPNIPDGEGDIDPLLKGAASITAEEIDTYIVNDVRNFLFGPPGSGGFDLDALNIQRGRDHGLPDYNTMREYYGLPRVTSFAEITSNVAVQQGLEALYGTVDNIDVYVGGLAEDHVEGGSVGPLFRAIIVDQFTRLRDGDRFWYQDIFSGIQLAKLEEVTLGDIIRRNTGITNLQKNVFFFPDREFEVVPVDAIHISGPSGGDGLTVSPTVISLTGSPESATTWLVATSIEAPSAPEERTPDSTGVPMAHPRKLAKLAVLDLLAATDQAFDLW